LSNISWILSLSFTLGGVFLYFTKTLDLEGFAIFFGVGILVEIAGRLERISEILQRERK